jgi:hypothetical protein
MGRLAAVALLNHAQRPQHSWLPTATASPKHTY